MSLSDRLRADVECAPWVIAAVQELERELARAKGLCAVAIAERDIAQFHEVRADERAKVIAEIKARLGL